MPKRFGLSCELNNVNSTSKQCLWDSRFEYCSLSGCRALVAAYGAIISRPIRMAEVVHQVRKEVPHDFSTWGFTSLNLKQVQPNRYNRYHTIFPGKRCHTIFRHEALHLSTLNRCNRIGTIGTTRLSDTNRLHYWVESFERMNRVVSSDSGWVLSSCDWVGLSQALLVIFWLDGALVKSTGLGVW